MLMFAEIINNFPSWYIIYSKIMFIFSTYY
jgi:hypothetical protein